MNDPHRNKFTLGKITNYVVQFLKKYKKYVLGFALMGIILLVKIKFYDKIISISEAMELIKKKKIENVLEILIFIGDNW